MLGGMSWESTALYYRVANELVREREGGLASADLLVRSVDFAAVRRLQLEDRWDDAADLLLREAKALEAGGAELVVLCTNYMHKVAPALEAGLGVPFLHIADVAAAAAKRLGRDPGRPDRCRRDDGRAVLRRPAAHARAGRGRAGCRRPDLLDRAVFDELCRGVLSDDTRTTLRAVLARLVEAGAQAVVLGCTELELLLGPADCAVPLLPTARLHVEAALAAAYA